MYKKMHIGERAAKVAELARQLGILDGLLDGPGKVILGRPIIFNFSLLLFFERKVMPYSRQRKAAKQVMQDLGDGTSAAPYGSSGQAPSAPGAPSGS